jgi:lipopolysaccharide transport system permease protein
MTSKIQQYIDLLIVLTQKELKVKYKSSFFGYLWSVGHPLAFAFVFFIAFKVIMRIPMEDYALFLMAGLFPWQWFSNSVNASPLSFLTNASLIKKVNFPRNIIVASLVLEGMIHFLLSIPVIILFIFIYQKAPKVSWLYGLPLLLGIQFLMTYGLSLLISSLNLFFRDLERLTIIITTLLFYFTPIIYPETMVPKQYQHWIKFNPLSFLMVSWRNLFLNGTLELTYLLISFAYAISAFLISYLLYRKLSWKFAEVL